MSTTRAEAERRIREAMAHVEKAQNELDRACQVLSNITHWAPEYSAVGKARMKVHALWWRLERKLRRGGKYDLDSFSAETFLKAANR